MNVPPLPPADGRDPALHGAAGPVPPLPPAAAVSGRGDLAGRGAGTATAGERPPAQQVVSQRATGSTHDVGDVTDDEQGRVFPCPNCGADLVFHIGQQRLKCPYCSHEQEIVLPEDVKIEERDYQRMLTQLREHHDAGRDSYAGMKEIRCRSCAGTVLFQGTLTSTRCPYCASPIQIDKAEQAADRIAVDGVLPFRIQHDKAAENLSAWVKSRWFAPNDFLSQGVRGDFNGVYLPFWTFDCMTFTRYSGQRGENYTVTVGTGKDRRTETRTRWYPASGSFQRFFDDVLVDASKGLNPDLVQELEPWPLQETASYNQQMIAGFLARTYDVELPQGFEKAQARVRSALESDVRQRIGGDRQQISHMDVQHSAITFKHLLLPVWMMAYRYHGQPYQVLVNAATGEVQGERPYSWMKITLAVIAGLILAALFFFLTQGGR